MQNKISKRIASLHHVMKKSYPDYGVFKKLKVYAIAALGTFFFVVDPISIWHLQL